MCASTIIERCFEPATEEGLFFLISVKFFFSQLVDFLDMDRVIYLEEATAPPLLNGFKEVNINNDI